MRFQGELVDIVLRNAISLGYLCGCFPEFHSVAGQHGRLGHSCLQVGRALRRATNNQGHLTSNLQPRPVSEFLQRPRR